MSERASPDSRTIAVLIPVFNDDGQLDATLRSIDEPGVPVVVVIVDDGSDNPVVVRHALRHEVVVLRHDVNRGIAHALNTGLAYIVDRGIPYVARIDNGDRCAPGRLARQHDFLERPPNVHLVSSADEWRDDAGRWPGHLVATCARPLRRADLLCRRRQPLGLLRRVVLYRAHALVPRPKSMRRRLT